MILNGLYWNRQTDERENKLVEWNRNNSEWLRSNMNHWK